MKIILFIAIIEVILFLVFLAMGMYRKSKFGKVVTSVIKGWVERGFICFGVLNELAVVIIFFGALKIATRLHDNEPSKISNDQFLMGNILSVSAAIIYFMIISGI